MIGRQCSIVVRHGASRCCIDELGWVAWRTAPMIRCRPHPLRFGSRRTGSRDGEAAEIDNRGSSSPVRSSILAEPRSGRHRQLDKGTTQVQRAWYGCPQMCLRGDDIIEAVGASRLQRFHSSADSVCSTAARSRVAGWHTPVAKPWRTNWGTHHKGEPAMREKYGVNACGIERQLRSSPRLLNVTSKEAASRSTRAPAASSRIIDPVAVAAPPKTRGYVERHVVPKMRSPASPSLEDVPLRVGSRSSAAAYTVTSGCCVELLDTFGSATNT